VAKLPDSPENRRRAIEALLQKIDVESSGEGRRKQATLTFYWLGQEPFTPLSLRDLANEVADFALEEVRDACVWR
jgi:hypothetical protein